jgi:AcrR family transcriptional regulator
VKDAEDLNVKTERRDAAENRKRILAAAKKLFEQYGIEKVSMNQIAVEAQIGPGTLYRRYSNKSELCLDLKKDNIVQFFEDIEKYLIQHHTDPPGQRLKEVLRLFICFGDKNYQLLKEIEGSAINNRSNSITQTPLYNKMHEITVKLLSEMTSSEHDEPNNVFRADMLVYALLKSDSYIFQKDVRGYSPESFLEQLCLTFFPTNIDID